jgi:hypothetical protein
MSNLCPFLKEACKEANCIMWHSGAESECIIRTYMMSSIRRSQACVGVEEELEDSQKLAMVPESIQDATVSDLARELADFVSKKTDGKGIDGDGFVGVAMSSDEFWESKGISHRINLPHDIGIKIDRAESKAQQLLDEDYEVRQKASLEKEKAQLLDLIEKCKQWAISIGRKKLTQSEVRVFLNQEGVELSAPSIRQLYDTVNFNLK